MRTFVRDLAELRLRPLPPCARPRQRHAGSVCRERASSRRARGSSGTARLLCDREPEKFSRAAVRWHGRYCRETKAGLDEAQAMLAALGALRGARREAAAAALSDLIYQRGLERASEAVNRWAAVGD